MWCFGGDSLDDKEEDDKDDGGGGGECDGTYLTCCNPQVTSVKMGHSPAK